DERGGTEKLNHEVAITNRVKAVARDAVKTEHPCDSIAIDGVRRSRERRRAQRQDVHALAGIHETFSIAGQHFEVRQTPMSEQNRLGALQMSVTRNDRLAIRFRQSEQSFLGALQETGGPIYFIAQP